LAVILGAAIAYHPRSFGKAATLEEVEQPKIYLMYAAVGALIGQICGHSELMAYVIFGLGGLFRFRTDVGPARDTGRLILVTLVGVLCGLMKPVPAVIATAVGWVLIYLLESRVAHRLTVKGLEPQVLAESASAYRSVIEELGVSILSEKKNFVKKQVAFVFRVAGGLDVEDLTGSSRLACPKTCRERSTGNRAERWPSSPADRGGVRATPRARPHLPAPHYPPFFPPLAPFAFFSLALSSLAFAASCALIDSATACV
jgi:hypothetical protein